MKKPRRKKSSVTVVLEVGRDKSLTKQWSAHLHLGGKPRCRKRLADPTPDIVLGRLPR